MRLCSGTGAAERRTKAAAPRAARRPARSRGIRPPSSSRRPRVRAPGTCGHAGPAPPGPGPRVAPAGRDGSGLPYAGAGRVRGRAAPALRSPRAAGPAPPRPALMKTCGAVSVCGSRARAGGAAAFCLRIRSGSVPSAVAVSGGNGANKRRCFVCEKVYALV